MGQCWVTTLALPFPATNRHEMGTVWTMSKSAALRVSRSSPWPAPEPSCSLLSGHGCQNTRFGVLLISLSQSSHSRSDKPSRMRIAMLPADIGRNRKKNVVPFSETEERCHTRGKAVQSVHRPAIAQQNNPVVRHSGENRAGSSHLVRWPRAELF